MIKIEQATIRDADKLAILFDQYRVFYEKPTDINGAKFW